MFSRMDAAIGHTRIECLVWIRDKWRRTRSEERLIRMNEIKGKGHTREESLIGMNEIRGKGRNKDILQDSFCKGSQRRTLKIL